MRKNLMWFLCECAIGWGSYGHAQAGNMKSCIALLLFSIAVWIYRNDFVEMERTKP